jgi:hypothetical protein
MTKDEELLSLRARVEELEGQLKVSESVARRLDKKLSRILIDQWQIGK